MISQRTTFFARMKITQIKRILTGLTPILGSEPIPLRLIDPNIMKCWFWWGIGVFMYVIIFIRVFVIFLCAVILVVCWMSNNFKKNCFDWLEFVVLTLTDNVVGLLFLSVLWKFSWFGSGVYLGVLLGWGRENIIYLVVVESLSLTM